MISPDALAKWELNMIMSIKYVLSILSNIYYIMIFIVYIKQRCTLSIKKGIILLMTLTLFILNILYFFISYDLIEKRNFNPTITPPTSCIIITSIRDTLVLINSFHFSFIFLYTYMGLYHSEFLVRNKKKICFLFLGLIWAGGISLCIPLCFDESMIASNIGDCKPRDLLFTLLYVPFSLISLIILLFSVVKIYLNIRRSEEPDDDETKSSKKKLLILGVVKGFEILLYPLYFTLPSNSIIISVRVAVQICTSFAFVMFYSYDDEFGGTMKEVFLCKKNSIHSIDDTIYDELSSKN